MAANEPPLPRQWRKFPVGNITRIKRTQRAFRVAYREWGRWLTDTIDNIPATEITGNSRGLTVNRYDYQIDLAQLEVIVREMAQRLGDAIPEDEFWQAVRSAYERGTADEVVNLGAIAAGQYTREITQVIQSDPWQRRVALMRARVLEELQGITDDSVRELRGVLSRGVADGINPMDLKRQINERVGVNMSRAERLARTEITMNYRRARWDEDDDANQRLGIKTGLLWISALLPDTRPNHAALHGDVVTQDFVRDFYTNPGDSINCSCAQVSVLLDEDDNVATPGIVKRVKLEADSNESPITNSRRCNHGYNGRGGL